MKIAHFHIALRLESGGVVRAVLDLCGLLADAGHDVTVVTTDARDAPDAWKSGKPGAPRVLTVPPPRLPGRLFTPAAVRAASARLAEADVLHLHGVWGPYNTQVAAAARRRGLPYVISAHGMLDDWCTANGALKKRLYFAVAERRTLHRAAAVHLTAQAEHDQSSTWYPPQRGRVIPLVMDFSPFRELPGPEPARAAIPVLAANAAAPSPRPVVLSLGRLHRKKGVENLLRAAARIAPAPLVVIAGTGEAAYERHLRDLAASVDGGDRIHFAGFVGGVEKISLFQAADVFALPTSQENFGFVLFESLAAATPLVTTRGVDTWPELAESGGAVITDAEPGALAEAINALLGDAERRAAMGAAGRAWVMENLGREALLARYEAFYAEACGSTSGH